ncbi:MAG: HAD-IB family phosphatase [Clostridia bacterium]|nr:HAD-IB family phosphatase [Clostridia bacterium]
MNVYDFDNTIYKGDSTRDFYFFTLKKNPKIIKYLPMQGYNFIKFIFHAINKTQFKEKFYTFFKDIDNIDAHLEEFWKIHRANFKSWYYDIQAEDDMVISASPEFLVKPMCDLAGIKYLEASRVDKFTGKYDGLNCWGSEKVRRFRAVCNKEIENFYSDSYSDSPLARISKNAYMVKGDRVYKWNELRRNAK